jgi:hypothetical protein
MTVSHTMLVSFTTSSTVMDGIRWVRIGVIRVPTVTLVVQVELVPSVAPVDRSVVRSGDPSAGSRSSKDVTVGMVPTSLVVPVSLVFLCRLQETTQIQERANPV